MTLKRFLAGLTLIAFPIVGRFSLMYLTFCPIPKLNEPGVLKTFWDVKASYYLAIGRSGRICLLKKGSSFQVYFFVSTWLVFSVIVRPWYWFCLAAGHASIFKTPCHAFFCVICKFLATNTFGNFLFDSASFILFNCVMWEPPINRSKLVIHISTLKVQSLNRYGILAIAINNC